MALSVRRSILPDSLLVVCGLVFCLVVLIPFAAAQRPIGRVGGAGVPAAPPVYHAPVYHPALSRPSYVPPRLNVRSTMRVGNLTVRPPFRPVRPPILVLDFFPFLNGAFWPFGFGSCWWAMCDQFWFSGLTYDAFSDGWDPGTDVVPPLAIPAYAYGQEGPDMPQLFLKDGSILNVTDYWLVDDQLHFMMAEEEGTKPTQHVVPFEALDLQKTVDVNTQRGFHFMLRDEPVDQYMRDHPDGPPQQQSPQH